MKVKVLNTTTNRNSNIEVNDTVFNKDYNESLLHQVSVSYLAGARSGTKAQKNRSAVRGGGKKPFSQKGGGRARAGTRSSPLWRSGGVIFAAQPRDFSKKVNKKMYQAAIRVIFSALLRDGRLKVVDKLALDKPSTKAVVALQEKLAVADALFITDVADKNLYLSTRNLYSAAAIDIAGINPIILIAFKTVVLTKAALKKINDWLKI